jgi:hypothetical protein
MAGQMQLTRREVSCGWFGPSEAIRRLLELGLQVRK